MLYDLNNMDVAKQIILSGKIYEFYELTPSGKIVVKEMVLAIGDSDDIVEKWSEIIHLCL